MSRFLECIKNGEVKSVCDGFVDAFEDMFDCSVDSIDIHVIDNKGIDVNIVMKKEI